MPVSVYSVFPIDLEFHRGWIWLSYSLLYLLHRSPVELAACKSTCFPIILPSQGIHFGFNLCQFDSWKWNSLCDAGKVEHRLICLFFLCNLPLCVLCVFFQLRTPLFPVDVKEAFFKIIKDSNLLSIIYFINITPLVCYF